MFERGVHLLTIDWLSRLGEGSLLFHQFSYGLGLAHRTIATQGNGRSDARTVLAVSVSRL